MKFDFCIFPIFVFSLFIFAERGFGDFYYLSVLSIKENGNEKEKNANIEYRF